MSSEPKKQPVAQKKDTQPIHEYISEYRAQLQKGSVRAAYRGLMQYLDSLRLHMHNKHPDYFVSGSVNQGLMDYSYFAFSSKSLQKRKLKVVILFIHDTFNFEVWLSGVNKTAQAEYLKLFKEAHWSKYPLAQTTKGEDYISRFVLVDGADFTDLDALTAQIEKRTLRFVGDVEGFLATH